MKKILPIVLTLVIFAVSYLLVGKGGGAAFAYLRKVVADSFFTGIPEGPWSETIALSDGVSATFPFPMKPRQLPLPDGTKSLIEESKFFACDRGGSNFTTGFILPRADAEMDLKGAAEGAITELTKRHPKVRADSEILPTQFGGRPAYELAVTIHDPAGIYQFNAIFFTDGRRMFQLLFVTPATTSNGPAVWKRLKDGVVFKSAAAGTSAIRAATDHEPLPPGIKKRVQ